MARVLIIEDNPTNMKLACLLLRHARHEVLCAVDAETGLTLARTGQPDLILMDMQLPGMDGLAATALLKQDALTAAIPVIALTALAMKADQERCQAAGCDGYIAKPLRYQALYAAIDALLVPGTTPAGDPMSSRKIEAMTPVVTNQAALDSGLRDQRLILVAEDNEINQKLILRQLALLGFAANVAGNGRVALERWQTGHYALLLTDLQMPEMNGYALAAAIRAQERGTQRIPIVALTANVRSREAERCRLAGIDDCLSKPLQLAELRATLDVWLPTPTGVTQGPSGATDPLAVAPVLDLCVLESSVGRDAPVILGFLIDFRSGLAALSAAIMSACAAGEARLSFELAHKLKSSALAVGARALGDLCARIETAGRLENTEILNSLVPMFEQEVDRLTATLDTFIDTSAHQAVTCQVIPT